MTKRPILFIHGAFSTAKVWENVIPYFTSLGHECFAPSLYPELRVTENPSPNLSLLSLQDYVDFFAKEAREIDIKCGCEPIIIGHSMGGLIAQKLAEMNVGAAAIFITPAAPIDCQHRNIAVAFTLFPIIAQNNHYKSYKIWRAGYEFGVANMVEAHKKQQMFDDQVYESGLVLHNIGFPNQDKHRTAIIDENKIKYPVLTIGALHDRTCPIEQIRKIARKYSHIGGDYKEFANAGHMIIDEPVTNDLLAYIEGWIIKKAN